MRIALIQLNAKIGDLQNNRLKIEKLGDSQAADLYVCPELCLSGYQARDLFASDDFHQAEQTEIKNLCDWSRKTQKSILIGHTALIDSKLFNAASLIQNGKITYTTLKKKLPNYNVFQEKRYFEPGAPTNFPLFMNGFQCKVEICEDSWVDVQHFFLDDTHRYSETLNTFDSDVLINLSASPFELGKAQKRQKLLSNLAKERKSTLVYVNFVGSQDELVFDGQSCVYDKNGNCLFEAPRFEEGIFVVDLNHSAPHALGQTSGWDDMQKTIQCFIRDYVQKSGHSKVVLGLSGGIDSALCAYLCSNVLGPQNVLGVALNSQWTSELSKIEAQNLAKNLGIEFRSLDIEPAVCEVQNQMSAPSKPLTNENLQSRMRGLILMAISNNENRLLISTANKSEIALGYSTLYGDMCGSMMPIGDLYKTEVYGLCHFLNRSNPMIPPATLTRAPSAELAENQKDSDSLPEYSKLDAFLEMYLESKFRFKKEKLYWDSFLNPHTTSQLIKKIQQNEFKRAQSPLICKVHHRSFGKFWQMPINI